MASSLVLLGGSSSCRWRSWCWRKFQLERKQFSDVDLEAAGASKAGSLFNLLKN